jgi:hypothetical protein
MTEPNRQRPAPPIAARLAITGVLVMLGPIGAIMLYPGWSWHRLGAYAFPAVGLYSGTCSLVAYYLATLIPKRL